MKKFLYVLVFMIALLAIFALVVNLHFDTGTTPAAAAADSNTGIQTVEEAPAVSMPGSAMDTSGKASDFLSDEEEPAESMPGSAEDTSGKASDFLSDEEEPAESMPGSDEDASGKASKRLSDFDIDEYKARLSKAYSEYDGVGKSAALSSFIPSKNDVIAVNCTVSDFVVRRSVEEAVVDAFASEGIICLMVSDYSGGLLYKDLTEKEKEALQAAMDRDGVKRYINIEKSSGIFSHYAITDAVFSFAVGRNEFTGAVSLESKRGYLIEGTFTSTLELVSDIVGDLLVKEYLKYCD